MCVWMRSVSKGSSSKKRVSCRDGTLITQRLHFASIPYTHRHVLGWYNILQELKESDVGVICVFDGRERNKAKAREVSNDLTHPLLSLIATSFSVDCSKAGSSKTVTGSRLS